MAPPVPIPTDVGSWLRGVFAGCNDRVSEKLTKVPTIHEIALDMAFVEHFQSVTQPRVFPSGWTVQINTHFLGGGRHIGDWPDLPRRWEIADIGLLVLYRQGGKILRSKVALLQSKRLYPDEQPWDEDSPLDYITGFSRLFEPDEQWREVVEPRAFHLTKNSRYKALAKGDNQYQAIARYEDQTNVPVYYLLYNPKRLPHAVTIPLTGEVAVAGPNEVGCRIVPGTDLRAAIADRADGQSPAYGELLNNLGDRFSLDTHPAGWRLEHFVVDLLLECQTGYVAQSRADQGLDYIFSRRSGPISAAIAVTLDAPKTNTGP